MAEEPIFDVVVVFAYGESERLNRPLVDALIGSDELLGLISTSPIVFTQKTIYNFLRGWKTDFREIHIAKQASQHISSYAIVSQFTELAKQKNWQRVRIIAAKQHFWRCQRDLKKSGFVVVGSRIIVGYNPSDSQFWVRNAFVWWIWEALLRLLPFALYKKISLRAV